MTDWVTLAPSVSLEILGEPTKKTSREWRWGKKGSLVLNVDEGTFYDFEADAGGGLIWLIKHKGLLPKDYIEGFDDKPDNTYKMQETPFKKGKAYNHNDMHRLKDESLFYVRYSDNFCVMRFNDNHYIKQKYAPFTRSGDLWYMQRPKSTLPIYISNDNKTVIVTEGEKAMIGASNVFDKAVCCHHGGVSNWENCDWSTLKSKDVIIWPDNDDAGRKFAFELQDHLNKISNSVVVVKPPRDFKDKDDLYDAYENNYFKSSDELYNYCLANQFKKKVSFELVPVSKIIANVQKPNWLIKDVCETDSVIAIFGAPKAGKSFVSVDMASHIALGLDWNDYYTKQSTVVYLAGEGQRGIARRINAWSQVNKQPLNDAPLLISSRGARLLDEADHKTLKDSLMEAEDNYGAIGMIVIDTLARNFGAGNENSTEDMNKFVEKVDDLKDQFGSCICLVHHTGHGNGARARGSSVLPAAVDWEYKVQREDINEEMFVTLSQSLVKDGNPIKPIDFKFNIVDLPFDESSSGALVKINDDEKPVRKLLNDNDEKILAFIHQTQSQSQEPANTWLRHTDIVNGTNLNKNIVNRSLKKLIEANKIEKTDNGYQTDEFKEQIF